MSFIRKMRTISICLLIFVISSDYAYGKLSSRRKKGHSDESEVAEDLSQHLQAESGQHTKETGGGSKESKRDSKESDRNSKGSSESRESEADSKEGENSKDNLLSESSSTDEDEVTTKQQKTPTTPWKKGTVPYRIDRKSYDNIIVRRIREAMKAIEGASCVIFKNMSRESVRGIGTWLHITNPGKERDCVHEPRIGNRGEAVMVLGFECMQKPDITHALLHALGFKDEVTHPQRDSYVRVLWENIQPKYHPLFAIQSEPSPFQLVEYDTMSVMHFHDRAFSSNGGATVTPLISGLVINPSEGLSQLDIMKLRLAFGHECNKRKVDNLLETCKSSLLAAGKESSSHESSSAEKETHNNTNKKRDNKKTKKQERDSEGSDQGSDQASDGGDKVTELSEPDAEDSGSDQLAIIEITTRSTTTKQVKSTTTNDSKRGLSGSIFGKLSGKHDRGRRVSKKKPNKDKKQTKTRQSKKHKQVKIKRNSKKNQTKKRSSRKRQ